MNKMTIHALFACLALMLSGTAVAQSPFSNKGKGLPIIRSSVLPVDQAFALSTFVEAPDTAVLLWDIRDGYYLYQKSLAVTDRDGNAVDLGELPISVMLTDEFFGDVEIYYNRLMLRFPLSRLPETGHDYHLTLKYQGCAQDQYCYPPQEKEIELTLPE